MDKSSLRVTFIFLAMVVFDALESHPHVLEHLTLVAPVLLLVWRTTRRK